MTGTDKLKEFSMDVNMINLSLVRQSFLSDDAYLELMDGEYPVDCKCPKCGKTHRVTMFWTGRGVPRKYCNQCKGGMARGYGYNRTVDTAAVGVLDDLRMTA